MGVKCLSYSRETWLWTGHRPLSVLSRRYRTVTKCPVRQLSTKQHAGRPRIAGYMGTKVSPNSLYLVGKGTSPHCFIIWTLNYVYNLIVMVNTVICMKNEKCPSEVSGTGIFGPRLVSLFGGCIGGVFLLENIHHWAWNSSQLFLLCDFYKGYELSDSCPCCLSWLFSFRMDHAPGTMRYINFFFWRSPCSLIFIKVAENDKYGVWVGENVPRTWRPWMTKKKEARPISDPCGQDWRVHRAVTWTGLFLLLTWENLESPGRGETQITNCLNPTALQSHL